MIMWGKYILPSYVTLLGILYPIFALSQEQSVEEVAEPLACMDTDILSSIQIEEDDETDTTLFDLYLGDTLQGLVLVKFTDTWSEIEDREGLIEQLTSVKEAEKLYPLFEGKIHTERIVDGIGRIKIDPSVFTVSITPDPKFMGLSKTNNALDLPDPENDFSLQQRFDVAASGEYNGDEDVAFTHRSMASVGKYFVKADGTLQENETNFDPDTIEDPIDRANAIMYQKYRNNDDDYVLNEAVAGTVLGEYQLGFGAIRTDGGQFSGSADILGVYFDTDEELFLNRDDLHGSRLTIYVPSKSRVEFFQGGRLISAQVLDFGLQDVDTSSFPHGSYYVDIVMHQDNGGIVRDRQFFTKSGMLAIRSHPIFTIKAGVLRNNMDVFDTPVYQADLRVRALSFLELNGGVSGTDNITLASIGFKANYLDYILSATLGTSSEGEYGYSADINGNLLGLNWYVSHSETSTDYNPEEPFAVEEQKPITLRDIELDLFNVFVDARETNSGTISFDIGPFMFQYRGTQNKLNGDETWAHGPNIRYNIINDVKNQLFLNAAFLKTNTGDEYNAALYYRRSLSEPFAIPRHSLEINTTSQGRSKKGNDIIRTSYEINNKTRGNKGSKVRFQNEYTNSHARNTKSYMSNEIHGEYTDNYIDTNGFIRRQSLNDSNKTTYGVNGSTSFLVDKTLTPQIAFPFKTDAALVVLVDSKTSSDEVELLIDNNPYETIKAGTKTVIGLQPYRTYKVAIRPLEKKEFVLYDEKVREVTLFPGNIAREEWKIDRMVVGIGRLVDEAGNPIEWKRIKGTKSYSTTEEDGFFQIEITGDENLYIDSGNIKCSITLPELDDAEFSAELGDVVCKK